MDIPEMGDSRVCQAKRGRKRQCLFNGTFIFNLALTGAFACDKHAFDVRELYKVFPHDRGDVPKKVGGNTACCRAKAYSHE